MTSHNYVAENIYRIKKQLNNDDILIVAVSRPLPLRLRLWRWKFGCGAGRKQECRSS